MLEMDINFLPNSNISIMKKNFQDKKEKSEPIKKNNLSKFVVILLGIMLIFFIKSLSDPYENEASSGFKGLIPALFDMATSLIWVILIIALFIYGFKKLISKN
jgi:hypothetical protein